MTLLERLRDEEANARSLAISLSQLTRRLAAMVEDAERCGDDRLSAQRAALPQTAQHERGGFLQVVVTTSRYYALLDDGEIVWRERESPRLSPWTTFHQMVEHPPFVSIAPLFDIIVALSADGGLWFPPATTESSWKRSAGT